MCIVFDKGILLFETFIKGQNTGGGLFINMLLVEYCLYHFHMIAYFEVIKIIYRNIKELECAQYKMLDKKQTKYTYLSI